MKKHLTYLGFSLLISLFGYQPVMAKIQVIDDQGNTVTLEKPAQRIISLAPSITELLFAVGAGEQLVGVVSYSDYPPAAKELPIIGGYQSPDYERIVAAQPDLIIAWQSGNGANHIEKLKALGFTVYANESRQFEDIPRALRHLAQLSGHSEQGEVAATQFQQRLTALDQHYAARAPVSVFYQIWNTPLLTINGEHIISKVITLCGGTNSFSDIDNLVPRLNLEAVLQANPEAIIASGMGNERPEWLDDWQRWKQLQAIINQHLYFINADLINRPTPRILDAAAEICELLDKVRQQRDKL